MPQKPRPFPPALPHGEIQEVLPGIYFVTGTVGMPGPLPVRFSRNMAIVREGTRLCLINSMRLDDAGLDALDALGEVHDVIRLAGFHGKDDPFYRDRYGAKIWAVKGQRYTAGFDAGATYFDADLEIDADTTLPLQGARIHVIASTPPEGVLVLPRHGGVAFTGDSLQNWAEPDAYFSWLGKAMMKALGFLKAHNVGPGWKKQSKPPVADVRAILDLDFDHVLPSHGAPVIGRARELFRPAIERMG